MELHVIYYEKYNLLYSLNKLSIVDIDENPCVSEALGMPTKEISYNRLPECVKTGLGNRQDLAGNLWAKRQIRLDELWDILPRLPQDDEDFQAIQRYNEDYLQRRGVCPPLVDIDLWPVNGFHRIVAYGMVAEEENTLPEWLNVGFVFDRVIDDGGAGLVWSIKLQGADTSTNRANISFRKREHKTKY